MKNKSENNKKSFKIETSRRLFIKKTAYAVPVLIVLGQLVRPSTAKAGVSTVTPPSGPGTGEQW